MNGNQQEITVKRNWCGNLNEQAQKIIYTGYMQVEGRKYEADIKRHKNSLKKKYI